MMMVIRMTVARNQGNVNILSSLMQIIILHSACLVYQETDQRAHHLLAWCQTQPRRKLERGQNTGWKSKKKFLKTKVFLSKILLRERFIKKKKKNNKNQFCPYTYLRPVKTNLFPFFPHLSPKDTCLFKVCWEKRKKNLFFKMLGYTYVPKTNFYQFFFLFFYDLSLGHHTNETYSCMAWISWVVSCSGSEPV